MGLDMYLHAETYLSGWNHEPDKTAKENFQAVLEMTGLAGIADPHSPSATVQATAIYWRKANQIHNWFVKNVQGGEDECRPHPVGKEDLTKLLDLCEKLLRTRSEDPEYGDRQAAELLPPQSGFFFGGTEIDDYYWEDIEYTAERLKLVLTEVPDRTYFEYVSSW